VTDKNPGGRTRLLTPELIERAQLYLTEWENEGDVIPSIAGLALFLGVSRDSVHTWRHQNELFSDTLAALLAKQERITLNKGLTGDFTAPISKLVLHNHGYSDKAEALNTLQGPGGGPIPWELQPVAAKAPDEPKD
jgi:hypothetical protein